MQRRALKRKTEIESSKPVKPRGKALHLSPDQVQRAATFDKQAVLDFARSVSPLAYAMVTAEKK